MAEKPYRLKLPDPDARPAMSLFKGDDPADLFQSGGVASFSTLTIVINILDGETVTIGGKVYTWNTILGAGDGDLFIGADAEASLDALVSAINLDPAGAGVLYAVATTLHPTVTAVDGAGTTVDVTAKFTGVAGDLLNTLEAITDGGAAWTGVVLAGGVDADAEVVFVPIISWSSMRIRIRISGADGNLGVEFARPHRDIAPGAGVNAFVYTADLPSINATVLADGVEQSLEISASEHQGENWLKVSLDVDNSGALVDFLDISGVLLGTAH